MSHSGAAKTTSKRLAEAEDDGDETSRKKEKPAASAEPESRTDAMEHIGALDAYLDGQFSISLPEERQEIIDELEAGSHMLVLEHNTTWSAKCRALECIVRKHRQCDERIRSPYRFNLQATEFNTAHWAQLDKPNRRFFHISCFEAIGINIKQYLTLPRPQVLRSTTFGELVSSDKFHPAVTDWLANDGRAFDAHLYEEYADLLERYQEEESKVYITHSLSCSGGRCDCGSPPVKPDRQDFLKGTPPERSLSDVLLQALGISCHKSAPYWLPEILGDDQSYSPSKSLVDRPDQA